MGCCSVDRAAQKCQLQSTDVLILPVRLFPQPQLSSTGSTLEQESSTQTTEVCWVFCSSTLAKRTSLVSRGLSTLEFQMAIADGPMAPSSGAPYTAHRSQRWRPHCTDGLGANCQPRGHRRRREFGLEEVVSTTVDCDN